MLDTKIFDRLAEAGFTITLNGESIRVEPKNRITDEVRSVIRESRDDLIAYLRSCDSSPVDRSASAPMKAFNLDLETLFDEFQERAAIMEFDAGLDRLEAEKRAFTAIFERLVRTGLK